MFLRTSLDSVAVGLDVGKAIFAQHLRCKRSLPSIHTRRNDQGIFRPIGYPQVD